MSGIARVLGPVVFLLGIAACAGSNEETRGATQMQAPGEAKCRASGEHCRWDNQCCSGRCYVDLGCSG